MLEGLLCMFELQVQPLYCCQTCTPAALIVRLIVKAYFQALLACWAAFAPEVHPLRSPSRQTVLVFCSM